MTLPGSIKAAAESARDEGVSLNQGKPEDLLRLWRWS